MAGFGDTAKGNYMTTYPQTLTTSDWVDYLEQPDLSRDDKIAALATWHRLIEYQARISALGTVSHDDPDTNALLTDAAAAIAAAVPLPSDYHPADVADLADVLTVPIPEVLVATRPRALPPIGRLG